MYPPDSAVRAPINRRLTNSGFLLAAMILALVGFGSVGTRQAIERVPSIDASQIALARLGQFDQRGSGSRSLPCAFIPTTAEPHLLMAQFTTEPVAARPELALEHLRSIRPDSTKRAALVKFFEGKARYQQRRYDLAEACWVGGAAAGPDCPRSGLGAGRPSR